MATAQELLTRLRQVARTPQEQGELFERFVVAYLRQDKRYGFSNVWRWRDWPGRGNETDSGIDIVAEERETGNLWAIQVKFHEAKLSLQDISTFLALSGRREFTHRLIVTASPLGPKAEEVLRAQDKPVAVLTLADILETPIDWDTFTWDKPENLPQQPEKQLRPYQAEAVEAVLKGFERSDRGKLIMPPGSGKTFVALKIAEKWAGAGGHVLFLAPSIALVEQTIRAWLSDAEVPLRVFAVTSDRTVGRDEESLDRTTVLTIPPTTNAEDLVRAYATHPDAMTVVVATYHSIDVIAEAQEKGFPMFDLIIADEAHRTTGVVKGEEGSYYTKVHDATFVRGKKRLYMTATPRVYVPGLKKKLEDLDIEYYSMDDETVYGEEFFRYGFGQAVDEGHLADYKVIVFAISEADVQSKLVEFLNRPDTPEVAEATRIIGTWRALSGHVQGGRMQAVKRAVVFAGQAIKDSRRFAEMFQKTVEAYAEKTGETTRRFEVRHVDGNMTATERKEHLDWLRADPEEDETRVLSNARVLTEGIDVPALDAVVFLKPRKSQVDVVQAVGRAMRKAPGKEYGYVVIPVIVDPTGDVDEQIRRNDEFRKVWEILSALRSIDDRFDARVRQLVLKKRNGATATSDNDNASDDMIIFDGEQLTLPLTFVEEISDKIIGVLVERVGEKHYFEDWAKDVAAVARRIERHIDEALASDGDYGTAARRAFNGYVDSLRQITNPSVTEEDARSMLVQHIITRPVFDALFGDYDFLKNNAVAESFERAAAVFKDFIEKETATLKGFYRSVQTRASGMDKEAERQDFLRRLYDRFFKLAFDKLADRLGIVYTPVEVVDFLVQSADHVLRNEFGLSLADKGVVILEPFTGTGTFLTRLMHLIPPEALERKYREGEIWGNEILLLPYYIALANVESTYFDITGKHEPFRNLLLVDSFQLMETDVIVDKEMNWKMFPKEYTALMQKQKEAKINVILSNPPWFAKQEDESLGIKAVKYEKLDKRIEETYAVDSSATNKNSLYDSYIRAIRMATDRIEDKGVIAFVTNSSFLDGNATDGLRKHLAQDFARIYVLNLRGNARLSGDARRKEGDGIFAEGSRAGVALLILVKDRSKAGPAEIYYHDIGDYLSREEKLARLKAYGHIGGVAWERITPNKAHDWINQQSEDFEAFPAIGAKQNGDKETIFELYSRGLQTSRDAWVYNYSRVYLTENMQKTITEYNKAVDTFSQSGRTTPEEFIRENTFVVSWSRELIKDLRRGQKHDFNPANIVPSVYRPFVRQWLYFAKSWNEMIYQIPKLFPEPGLENIVIVVQGPGNNKDFTVLIINHIPDLQLVGNTQTFPLYTYEPVSDTDILAGNIAGETIVVVPSGRRYIRRENITDWALDEYRKRYGADVTKEDIFYFVYGFLHSSEYRERYRNDLKKSLPRIPFIASKKDFRAFADAGRRLAELHLNYETVEPWPLEEEIKGDPNDPATYRVAKMRFGKTPGGKPDKTVIVYNDHITLRGIPLEAYEYVVNGKPAIEWLMERYQVRRDKKSGIVNDPNKWLEEQGDPRYIVDLIKRVVRVSVETVKIMKELPGLNLA